MCRKIALKKFVWVCDTHRFAFWHLLVFETEKENLTVKDGADCDIPSGLYLFYIFYFCWFTKLDRCPPPRLKPEIMPWLQCEGRSEYEMTVWDSKKLKEKVQTPRWLDSAAGSKLVTRKYGRLVYVCFIKHLFLVLFLAALAAGCQQGSWFWSSAQI